MAALSVSIPLLLANLNSIPQSSFAKEHHLKTLRSKLSLLRNFTADAEKRQLVDKGVKNWVEKLEDVVYDMEDIVHEILDETRQRKLEAESRYHPKSITASEYGKRMSSEIEEIVKVIDTLYREKDKFAFTRGRRFNDSPFLEPDGLLSPSDFPDETLIKGREKEKSDIVSLLLSGDETHHVIAIVGKAGVGKTTLAKIVYKDEKVRAHFDLRRWISLSNLSNLHRSLEDGKKVLLVLEDMSSSSDIDIFKSLKDKVQRSGARGSKFMITTSSESIAADMGCSTPYLLDPLTMDDSWSILATSALGRRKRGPGFAHSEYIGRRLVEKCHGLPLYARTIGRLLRFKTTAEEWGDVLYILENKFKGAKEPILSVSYYDLPSHLKRCFAYCSLFPRDCKFQKEELVLLWMAEGFLQRSSGLSMEEVGAQFFDALVKRSFFAQVGNSYFKMHHLMHDLGASKFGRVCCRLDLDEERNSSKINAAIRYLSLPSGRFYYTFDMSTIIKLGKMRLRTFLLNCSLEDHEPCGVRLEDLEEFFHRQPSLRVLSLISLQFVCGLPESVTELKHLRYLDLSHSYLLCLPESICALYYLQTLKLTGCRLLQMLPQSIVQLVNLRHLNIEGTDLRQMPEEMGRLKALQTLTNFILGADGSNLQQLGALVELRETLSLSGLQNVISASDASAAGLKAKKYVKQLQLQWSLIDEDPVSSEVLKNLEPSKELKGLTIRCYAGRVFPSWLGDFSFSNILFLCLSDCNNCLFLPPLGRLPSLERLVIENMRRIRSIGNELYGMDSSISTPFKSLKTLIFREMTQWERWISLEGDEFPRLLKLYIFNCPNLKECLPKSLPSLVKLKIIHCEQLEAFLPETPDTCRMELDHCGKVHRQKINDDNLLKDDEVTASQFQPSTSEISIQPNDGPSATSSKNQDDASASPIENQDHGSASSSKNQDDAVASSSSVTLKVSTMKKLLDLPSNLLSLRIESCDALESLPTGILDRPSLQRLFIIDCPSLKTFPQTYRSSSLRRLYIRNCRILEFPQTQEMANHYIFLEHLCLGSSCDSLKSFHLNCFPRLKILSLWDCRNLENLSIKKEWKINAQTSLDALEIRDCPSLRMFPDGGLKAPSLTSIIFSNCENLYSLPTKMEDLTSLQSLHINNCPQLSEALKPLPPWSMPSKLNILCISFCDKITPQRAWKLENLKNLSHFEIEGGCQEVDTFPEEGLLPINLNSLRISSLPKLTTLKAEGLRNLTSLKTLEINCCNNLVSLPEQGLPSSLSFLSITDCSLLIPKLQDRNGEEWFKTVHIPSIHLH